MLDHQDDTLIVGGCSWGAQISADQWARGVQPLLLGYPSLRAHWLTAGTL